MRSVNDLTIPTREPTHHLAWAKQPMTVALRLNMIKDISDKALLTFQTIIRHANPQMDWVTSVSVRALSKDRGFKSATPVIAHIKEIIDKGYLKSIGRRSKSNAYQPTMKTWITLRLLPTDTNYMTHPAVETSNG